MRPIESGRNRFSPTFLIAAGFLVAIALFGGASRADSQAQIFARLVSVAFGALALMFFQRSSISRISTPLAFLALLGGAILIQLIPLPPGMWAALPGRGELSGLLAKSQVPEVWRPLSLDPDATINSFFALLPAAAMLLVLGITPGIQRERLGYVLVGLAFCSGFLGLMQISSSSPLLYFYRITNQGAAVGLFANRNHQGLLLALALPLLVMFALARRGPWDARRRAIAAAIAAFLVPLIVVTGSRAALVVAAIGAVAAYFAVTIGGSAKDPIARRRDRSRRGSRRRRKGPLIASGVVAVLVVVTALSSRAQSVQRLFNEDVSQEIRLRLFEPLVAMGWKYFPVGAGFGSFVPLYQMHERAADLSLSYLNHAHNDLLELFIEAGLLGLLLVAAFAIWFLRQTIRTWAGRDGGERALYGRIGSIMIAIIGLASLADYPLRTPTVSAIFVLACVWLHQAGEQQRPVPTRADTDDGIPIVPSFT